MVASKTFKFRGKEIDRKQFYYFCISFLLIGSGALVAIGGITYWAFSRSLPRIITVADYRPRGVTRVIAKDEIGKEQVVAEFYKERRYLVPFDYIPDQVVHAFLSAEDDGFFEHQGISPMSILRAAIANFRAGHVVQGGSTITQQVAKSLFLTPERTFIRKIKEAILSGRIEENLSKQQILYLYLNQIYLGHGAYGVQAAARAYFNKDVRSLTLPEAALIAGMPRAPGRYSPYQNPKRAKEIQRYVLRRMYENNYISEEEMLQAIAHPLRVFIRETEPKVGEYVVENVRRYIAQNYGEKMLYEGGLDIYIPSNTKQFRYSREAVRDGIRAVDKRLGYRGPIRKLQTEEEIGKFVDDSRKDLIRRRVPYQLLFPDGRMGLLEAGDDAGFSSDEDLLKANDVYEAVVISVEDDTGMAHILIGAAELELPMETMTWAREPEKEDQKKKNEEPKLPSEVVAPGDVVLVKVIKRDTLESEKEKKKEKKNEGEEEVEKSIYVASLEQYPQVQGALFSMEVNTGYVIAIEGGYDFKRSEFNRAVQARRQLGSAFKPIIFSAAVERGYTPASIIVDSPLVFQDESIGKWKPTNFKEQFYGDTTLRKAFIMSRNIPTIRLVVEQGIQSIIDYSHRLGITANFNADLSISLGSGATTLAELTSVYASYPRRGMSVSPIYIKKIINRDGLVLEETLPHPVPDELGSEIPLAPAHLLAEQVPAVSANVSPAQTGDPNAPLNEVMEIRNQAAGVVSPQANAAEVPPPAESVEEQIATDPQYHFINEDVFVPHYPTEEYPDQLMDPRVAYVMTHLLKEVVEYGTGRRAKALRRPGGRKDWDYE